LNIVISNNKQKYWAEKTNKRHSSLTVQRQCNQGCVDVQRLSNTCCPDTLDAVVFKRENRFSQSQTKTQYSTHNQTKVKSMWCSLSTCRQYVSHHRHKFHFLVTKCLEHTTQTTILLTSQTKHNQCRVHFQCFGNTHRTDISNTIFYFVRSVNFETTRQQDCSIYHSDSSNVMLCSLSILLQAVLHHYDKCYCLLFWQTQHNWN